MSFNAARTTRYTKEQMTAMEQAAKNRRSRTGALVEVSDIIRDGAGLACAAEGVPWPAETEAEAKAEQET